MDTSGISTTMASRSASADSIFINYSLVREAHEMFDFLIAHAEQRGEKSKRCVLVVGPSQAGKSSIIESYVARLNTKELLAQRKIPVLHVTLEANTTRKGLAESILEAIQDYGYADVSTSGSETILLQRARRYMKVAGVKLLVLDEFHHVINSDSAKVASSVGETIKRMLIKGVCAIVLVGIEAARDPFLANPQLAQRAEPAIELRSLDAGSVGDIQLFSKFLSAYLLELEKTGIVGNAVNLLDAETVFKIFEISEGTLGRACNLVKAAIKLAAKADRNYIILDDLARAADRIYKGKCKGNPFARALAPLTVG